MEPRYVTCPCRHCGSNIEFDANQLDACGGADGTPAERSVTCPHCGRETLLFIPPEPEPAPARESAHGPTRNTETRTGASELRPPLLNPNLRKCKDCGKDVSINAEVCPHCGAPFISRKKHGVFFYVFWGVISLMATALILSVGWAFLSGVFEAAAPPATSKDRPLTAAEEEDVVWKYLHPVPQERLDAQSLLKRLHRSEDDVLRITWLKPYWVWEEDRRISESVRPPFEHPKDRLYLYTGVTESNYARLRLKIEYQGERMLITNFLFRIDNALESVEPSKPFVSALYSIKGQYDEPAIPYLDVIEKIANGKTVIMRYQGTPYSRDRTVSESEKTSLRQMLLVYRYLKEQPGMRP